MDDIIEIAVEVVGEVLAIILIRLFIVHCRKRNKEDLCIQPACLAFCVKEELC